MLNEEKIKLMTKIAFYEQSSEGREAIKSSRYFINDYLARNIIWTEICVTVAYVLMLLLITVLKMDTLVEDIANINYKSLGILILCVYIVLLISFFIIGYFVYGKRYIKLKQSLSEYNSSLKELNKIYKSEEETIKDDLTFEE